MTAYIKAKLEQASLVWSPLLKKLIDLPEKEGNENYT